MEKNVFIREPTMLNSMKNPAFDYDGLEHDYANHRKTDPRIAEYIHRALEPAKTILNVGAGSGSYEPNDIHVTSVEPSAVMREKRIGLGRPPAINARAEQIPFDDNSFDASMALVTVHHWPDIQAGLNEMRRVTKSQILVLTFDPDALDRFWNTQYFPELVAVEKERYPTIASLISWLGGNCEVIEIPIPLDCTDGFQEAFYGRPEAFLDKKVRQAQSAWGFLSEEMQTALTRRLALELTSGEWDRKFGHHRKMESFNGSLRLIVSQPN